MTLSIEKIEFRQFRGYTHLELSEFAPLTVIVGPNAVGKTNIIEGIQLLTAGESFRKPSWKETVTWGFEQAQLSARFTDGGVRDIEHRLLINGNERRYEINGKKKSASKVHETCPCVLFIPDDLQMVKSSSAQRRSALDDLGIQLSKNYSALKNEYQQVLRQRNMLIRDDLAYGPLFDSWNESLVIHGARLALSRWKLFSRLKDHIERIYPEIVPHEELSVSYIFSWERFDDEGRQIGDVHEYPGESDHVHTIDEIENLERTSLEKLLPIELRRKTSLVGPHKDEIAFFINGKNARLFGSQGQQRTIVLVEKLAELALVTEMCEQRPILLLDDVMSELDELHRTALMRFIEQAAQTFLTTTNLGYFPEQLDDSTKVIEVPIPGTRI